jgi:hypothetical protein
MRHNAALGSALRRAHTLLQNSGRAARLYEQTLSSGIYWFKMLETTRTPIQARESPFHQGATYGREVSDTLFTHYKSHNLNPPSKASI